MVSQNRVLTAVEIMVVGLWFCVVEFGNCRIQAFSTPIIHQDRHQRIDRDPLQVSLREASWALKSNRGVEGEMVASGRFSLTKLIANVGRGSTKNG